MAATTLIDDFNILVEDAIRFYPNHYAIKAMLRDSKTAMTLTPATTDDVYDSGSIMMAYVREKNNCLHKYNYVCRCLYCGNTTRGLLHEIFRHPDVQTPRLHYLDAAFEEIFKYGSWRHDGVPWYVDRDEIRESMRIYYPGYGCSISDAEDGGLFVYIHNVPYFFIQQKKYVDTPSTRYLLNYSDIPNHAINFDTLQRPNSAPEPIDDGDDSDDDAIDDDGGDYADIYGDLDDGIDDGLDDSNYPQLVDVLYNNYVSFFA